MVKNNKELVGIIFGAMVSVALFGGSGAFAAETPYSIIYDSGVVTDMPTDEDSKTMNDTVQISSSKPKRTGLSFYGWCNTVPTNVDGNDTCSGTTFTIGGDWSIDPTTVNNNLRLYAMWGEERPEPQPSTARCINYHANASTAVGTMGCQSATDNASVTLLASNFSRTGYGFAGWSDSFDYATNPNAKFYGPQETITAPVGTTANGLSLYAVWVKSEGNLQDTNKVTALCGTNGVGGSLTAAPTDGTANLTSVSALTDQRDNQTYAIARLADGNCWMIENLRLESTADHNSDGTLAEGYGTSATYGNFGGLADAESVNFFTSATANSLYYSGTQEGTASIDIGTANHPHHRMPRYNNLNTPANANDRPQNPTSNTFTNDNTTVGMYSYGNYYTWAAAIADTTYYSSGDHNTTSICPTGWQLPLGNTSTGDIAQGAADAANKVGGFSYLDRKMGGTGASQSTTAASLRWRKFPVNFLYSGSFSGSSAGNRGGGGNYWSSTARDSVDSYRLYLNSSDVYPGTYNRNKYFGLSIRCTVGS